MEISNLEFEIRVWSFDFGKYSGKNKTEQVIVDSMFRSGNCEFSEFEISNSLNTWVNLHKIIKLTPLFFLSPLWEHGSLHHVHQGSLRLALLTLWTRLSLWWRLPRPGGLCSGILPLQPLDASSTPLPLHGVTIRNTSGQWQMFSRRQKNLQFINHWWI